MLKPHWLGQIEHFLSKLFWVENKVLIELNNSECGRVHGWKVFVVKMLTNTYLEAVLQHTWRGAGWYAVPILSLSLWVSPVAKPHLLSPCSLGVPWCSGTVVPPGLCRLHERFRNWKPAFHTCKCRQRWDGCFAWECFQALVESHQQLDFSLKSDVGSVPVPVPPRRKCLSFFFFFHGNEIFSLRKWPIVLRALPVMHNSQVQLLFPDFL